MPRATPSKAELPKKPPKVRAVKDAALMAQRVAEYDRLMDIYNAEMIEYEAGERARENGKKAAKRRAGAAAAAEQGGERTPSRSRSSPSPSPKQPKASPSPKQPKRNTHALPSQPTARQLAAAVMSNVRLPGPPNSRGFDPHVRDHEAFSREDPARQAKQMAWVEDVARFAEQAGVLTAPLLYYGGSWCAHRGKPATR